MAIHSSTYNHKMLPGQTLSQIAALYGVPLSQIAQSNDLAAEIADDNDLSGAVLKINLPSSSDGFPLFMQRYAAFVALVVNNESRVEENLAQFFSFLNQSIEDVYQRLYVNYSFIADYLHTAHSAWNYFLASDERWGAAVCYRQPGRKGVLMENALLPLGLNRTALMKARVEQLFTDESLFIARMQGEP